MLGNSGIELISLRKWETMTLRKLFTGVVFGSVTLCLSGCYTTLHGPRTAANVTAQEEQAYADWDENNVRLSRFKENIDPWNDFYYPEQRGYGYGAYSGLGGYGGFPIFGYDSRNGLHGYGGAPLGYSPYGHNYSGYDPYYGYGGGGPSGYGYDPYYYDSQGSYIPAGYELVTTSELQQLRSAQNTLSTPTADQASDLESLTLRRERQRKRDYVWDQRSTPMRSAPPKTVRTATSGSTEKSSSSKTTSSEKSSDSPKPKRRGGR